MTERLPVPACETALPNIFFGPPWRQTSRYRYRAKIDGARVGVVVAARTWRFDNHALNKSDFDRLLEAKLSGKISLSWWPHVSRKKISTLTSFTATPKNCTKI